MTQDSDTGLVPAGSAATVVGAVVAQLPPVPDEAREHVEGVVYHVLALVDVLADEAVEVDG